VQIDLDATNCLGLVRERVAWTGGTELVAHDSHCPDTFAFFQHSVPMLRYRYLYAPTSRPVYTAARLARVVERNRPRVPIPSCSVAYKHCCGMEDDDEGFEIDLGFGASGRTRRICLVCSYTYSS
jgi:hypothetical protein